MLGLNGSLNMLMRSLNLMYSWYNIKKKEEVQEMAPQEEPNPLMRKKKTPEELAAEAEAEDEDEFTITDSMPNNGILTSIATTVTDIFTVGTFMCSKTTVSASIALTFTTTTVTALACDGGNRHPL
ncbi:hypothetical protein QAD02_022788 [Eretmocerus hayati]|uniref:Uncharacterized protein n=1 Tax=Eretmocerus hayati TaxID=131215 RepID=A0ACC2PTR8_9HYME|nr:hypothetical protein QAD02_022788 [Eretmocerus hayati]